MLGHDGVTGGGASAGLTLVGPPATAHAGGMSRTRRIVVRCLAGVYALLWLLPGFAIIDLTVTWDRSWPVMLEAGWGLLFGALVAAPFAALVVVPDTPGAVLQLITVCLSIALAATLSLAWAAAVLAAVLAAQIATVMLGGPRRPWRALGPRQLSWPLLTVAVAGSGPWLAYAFRMFAADRANRPDSDVTLGVDHYAIQGALALALVESDVPRRVVAGSVVGGHVRGRGVGRLSRHRFTGAPRYRRWLQFGLVVGGHRLGRGCRGCRLVQPAPPICLKGLDLESCQE